MTARESPLLTKAQAAAYLNLSQRTFYRFVANHVTRVRIGGRYLYERTELDRWIASQRVEPAVPMRPEYGSRMRGTAKDEERARASLKELRKPSYWKARRENADR